MNDDDQNDRGPRYYAKVEPEPDGKWEVAVWSADPFWDGMSGSPRSIAERLNLRIADVQRVVWTERKARKVAARMIARCERRHAAFYDREPFEVHTHINDGDGDDYV